MSVSSGSDVTIPIQDSPPPPPSPYANRSDESSDGGGSKNNLIKEKKSSDSKSLGGIDNKAYQSQSQAELDAQHKRAKSVDCKITMMNHNNGQNTQSEQQNNHPNQNQHHNNGHGASNNSKEQEGAISETLNSELINLNILNTIPNKPTSEYGPYENFDTYFIPVNTHKKFLRRSEKLYVTKDKRKSNNSKKYACWIIGGLILSGIVTVAILAGLGLISQQNKSPPSVTESVLGTSPSLTATTISPSLSPIKETTFIGTTFVSTTTTTSRPSTTNQPQPPSDTYVPAALDLQFTLDNATYDEALYNKSSREFQELAFKLEEDVKSILRNFLGIDVVFSKVMEFMPGSVVVKMRIGWIEPEGHTIRIEDVKQYLMSIRFIGTYLIRQGTFTSYGLMNLCKFPALSGCSHMCSFDYESLDILCSCPEFMILSSNSRDCIDSGAGFVTSSELPSIDSSTENDQIPLSSSTEAPESPLSLSSISPNDEIVEIENISSTTATYPSMVSHPSSESIPITDDEIESNVTSSSSENPTDIDSYVSTTTTTTTTTPIPETSHEPDFVSTSAEPFVTTTEEDDFQDNHFSTSTTPKESHTETEIQQTQTPIVVMDLVTSISTTASPQTAWTFTPEISTGHPDLTTTGSTITTTTTRPTESTQSHTDFNQSNETISTVGIRDTESTPNPTGTTGTPTPTTISIPLTDIPMTSSEAALDQRNNSKSRRFETVGPIIVDSRLNNQHNFSVDSNELLMNGGGRENTEQYDTSSDNNRSNGGESRSYNSGSGSNESSGNSGGGETSSENILHVDPQSQPISDEHVGTGLNNNINQQEGQEKEREVEDVTEWTTIEPISLLNDTLVNLDESNTEDTLNAEHFSPEIDNVVAAETVNSNDQNQNQNVQEQEREPEQVYPNTPSNIDEDDPEQILTTIQPIQLPTDINAEVHVQGHPIDPPRPTASDSEEEKLDLHSFLNHNNTFTTPSPLEFPIFSTTLKILPNANSFYEGGSSSSSTSRSAESSDNDNDLESNK